MIEFCDVSFTYEEKKEASIKNINFKIESGELVLLTGLSGSGKSTVLKCINGLIPNLYEGTLTGQIKLNNENIQNLSMEEINHQIGSVFQNPRSQFFTTNTSTELAFSMENYGYAPSLMKDKMKKLSQKFHIENIMNQNIFHISSGERQLLSLACAFSLSPNILLFDEPSSNLDYGMTLLIRQYIKALKELGYTVIVADHRYFYLNNLLDKVIVIDDGTVGGVYTEAEFKESKYPLRSFSLFDKPYNLTQPQLRDTCLTINNLSFKNILKDINLQLKQGEILAVLGRNGAGKTTLAKLICGMEKPVNGTISSSPAMFVMQDSDYQLFGTSVKNELKILPNTVTDEQIQEALTLVDLWSLKYRHPFNLSGGEKQRLQIATTHVADVSLTIFDEPTSGLDFNSMNNVTSLIHNLAKKQGIIVISHDYEFICQVASRVVYLENGTIQNNFTLNHSTIEQLNQIFRKMEPTEGEKI